MDGRARCVFCGATGSAATMDVTGHGPRCPRCTAVAEQQPMAGGEASMAAHLTPDELRAVARAGTREAGFGLALAAVVGAGLASGIAVAAFVVPLFTGLGMAGRGLHRRRQARRALAEQPSARVVR